MSRRQQSWQAEVDALLEDWGRWSRGDGLRELGYPRMSAHHKMRRRDGLDIPPAPVPDDQAERVEEAVKQLPVQLRIVLREKYLWEALDNDAARRLKISVLTYRKRVEVAHGYVAGLLGMNTAA